MPESSLTEDAEITPDGNLSAASAQVATGVGVTGIPGRTARLGMSIDTHMRVVDGRIFSGPPGVRRPVELLVERDTPVLINRDCSISALRKAIDPGALADLFLRPGHQGRGAGRDQPAAEQPGRLRPGQR